MPWVPAADPTSTTDPPDNTTPKKGKWVPVGKDGRVAATPGTKDDPLAHALPGADAAISAAPPPLMRAAETGLQFLGAGLGGAGGAALGGAGAELAGPEAVPAGAYAGGRAGGAAGMTLADIANAKINQKLYHHDVDLSAGNVAKDAATNLGGEIVGHGLATVAGPALAAAGRGIIGKGAVETAAKDATEQAATAADHVASTEADASRTAAENYDKLHAKLLKQADTDARSETIANTLGRTEQQTREAMTLPTEVGQTETGPSAAPGPETTARRTAFYSAVYGQPNRTGKVLGAKFENLFADHMDNPVPVATIGKAAQDEMAYAQANNVTYSRPVQQLLDEAQSMEQSAGGSITPKELGYSPKEWAKMPAEEQQQRLSMARKLVPASASAAQTQAARAGVEQNVASTPARTLLGLRSKIGAQMAGASGPDAAVLHNLRDSVDDALSESGVPGAKQLRAQYRGFKTDFGKDFYRAISNAKDPIDAAPAIFNEPQRALQLATGATPEEKQTLREMYGDAVNQEVIKPQPTQAKALKALGFQGPLTNPDAWIYQKAGMNRLSEMFETSPVAAAKFQKSIAQAQLQARTDVGDRIIKEAQKAAKGMGPTGQRIMQAINAAKTPEQKVDIAIKAFSSPDLSQQAGVDAIQNFKPSSSGFYAYMKRRAVIYAMLGPPMIVGGQIAGHPGMGMTMGAGAMLLGGPIAMREGIAAAYRYSLRNPETAARFYQAIMNPGAAGSLDTIAKYSLEGTLATAGADVTKREAGVSLDKGPSKPSDMVKFIDHSKAAAIAGPRASADPGRVDTIDKTRKAVAGGATPNVHDALRGGHMSMSDVRKVVDDKEPSTVAGIFHGMSLSDAIDAMGRATPQEKEMAWPALAQKMNDEGGKLPPEQKTAMLSQLRRVMQSDATQTG